MNAEVRPIDPKTSTTVGSNPSTGRPGLEEVDEALARLARRCLRLANVVEASSRRRDVRLFRARIMLLLLELSCPPRGRPRRRWYVPGAVARLGAEGLRRAWLGFYGEGPRGLPAFRSHLRALEQACALVQSPGDWLPWLRTAEHPERRPRYPNTIHLLEGDELAAYWSADGEGRLLLERYPEATWSPEAWARVFSSWRARAQARPVELVGTLFEHLEEDPIDCRTGSAARPLGPLWGGNPRAPSGGPAVEPLPCAPEGPRSRAELALGFRRLALDEAAGPFELLAGARELGARIHGRNSFRVAGDPGRLRGVCAMLAIAYARGDTVRNRAGWIVRGFDHAGEDERTSALAACRRRSPWRRER